MRKLVLLAMLMFCVSSFAKEEDPIVARYVLIPCGTVYKIPLDMTDEELFKFINKMIELDCDPEDDTKPKREVDHRSGPNND